MPLWGWIIIGIVAVSIASYSIWWANVKAQELYDALDKWDPPTPR